jgi:hypothetical protein
MEIAVRPSFCPITRIGVFCLASWRNARTSLAVQRL